MVRPDLKAAAAAARRHPAPAAAVESAAISPAGQPPASAYGLRVAAALQTAARAGDASVLAALLNDPCGARYVDATDAEGRTALYFAAAGGHDAAAQALLLAGADADAADSQQQTALHVAAASNVSTVQLLLNHGADATKADAPGRLPLHIAAGACSAGLASASKTAAALALARRCPAALQQRAQDGDTPVHALCRGYSWLALAVLGGLQKAGLLCAQVLTCTNKAGHTPLALAALCGEEETAAYLLPLCPPAAMGASCAACTAAAAAAGEEEQGDERWGSSASVAASCAGHTCALAAAATRDQHKLMLRIVGFCGASAAGLSSHVLGAAVADGRADVAVALLAAGLRCRPSLPLCMAVEAGDAAALRTLLRAGEAT